MTHITCRLTAKNRDQLRNPRLGNRVWAAFLLLDSIKVRGECEKQRGDSVGNTAEQNSSFFPNPKALVAVSKGMRTVELCTGNKILQFLTGCVG